MMRHVFAHEVRRCLIACVGPTLLLLSGCSLVPFNQPSPQPPSRQILRLGLDQFFEAYHSLDPAISPVGFPAILIFPPLLTADNQLNVEPWAAESLPTFDP